MKTPEEIETAAEQFVFTAQLEGDDAETGKLCFMDGASWALEQASQVECRLNDVIAIKDNYIERWMKESATFQARKDILEEWLTEYRDELKKANVYHKNEAIIREINDLLNWPE